MSFRRRLALWICPELVPQSDRETQCEGEFLRELTHLPIWPSARRPSWWHHLDVREFLTVAHRQMSCIEAERQGKQHFGERCPRKTAIHSYWQRLDVAKTGKTLHLTRPGHYRNPVLPAPTKQEDAA